MAGATGVAFPKLCSSSLISSAALICSPDEWNMALDSERLTDTLLDRLTHHVHILEMNWDSFRLKTAGRSRGTTA